MKMREDEVVSSSVRRITCSTQHARGQGGGFGCWQHARRMLPRRRLAGWLASWQQVFTQQQARCITCAALNKHPTAPNKHPTEANQRALSPPAALPRGWRRWTAGAQTAWPCCAACWSPACRGDTGAEWDDFSTTRELQPGHVVPAVSQQANAPVAVWMSWYWRTKAAGALTTQPVTVEYTRTVS